MINLITDHIDIWTSAQTQKTNGAGRGKSSANQSAHGIKKLRELILELAVRGKLVPQDPNDEPASVLLEKITKEKLRLIKEGKIKKQEPLPEITDDEKAFELPRGWEWVRLAGVTEFVNGYAFKSSDFSDIGVGVVKIGDIQNGEITTASMSRVAEDIVAGLDDSLKVNNGDMLIAMSGATTGKLGFNRTNEVFYINQRVGKIIPHCLYVEYLYHPLTTKISENLAKSMGSAIPNLSTAQIKDIVFALPPVPEQHRIVAKVDELMAICDKLEQQQTDSNAAHQILVETLLATLISAANQDEFVEAWQRIARYFDILFTTEQSIDQLKQTILQLAVMGKLVPQVPNDEPASVLLKKIAAEKARLIKEGKLKKQEPLLNVVESEKSFELPEGWEWTRLGNLSANIHYGYTASADHANSGIRLLRITDIQNDSVDWKTVPGCEIEEDKASDYLLENDDILIARTGGTIGKSYLVKNINVKAVFASYLIRVKRIEGMYSPFIKTYLGSQLYWQQLYENSMGTGQPNVNATALKRLVFPLPPFAEQQHIVAKVDALMALCDTLKAQINDAQTTQIQLADTIVEQAVA
jgi:type I restriction enzyme S subunit